MTVIAITGATGFVGGRLYQKLLEMGIKLRLLIRDPAKISIQHNNDCYIVKGDLSDGNALNELCNGADIVIHCAGVLVAKSEEEFINVNVNGTDNLIKAAKISGVSKFILLSSLAARSPNITAYGLSKFKGEQVLQKNYGSMDWLILRPSGVYGPGDKATLPLIKSLSGKFLLIPGDKNSTFSLIYIDDLIDAIVIAAKDNDVGNNLWNKIYELGDGAPYSWFNIVDIARNIFNQNIKAIFIPRFFAKVIAWSVLWLAVVIGFRPKITPDKIKILYHDNWSCDNSSYCHNSFWQPKVDFSQGVKFTYDWYCDKGWI